MANSSDLIQLTDRLAATSVCRKLLPGRNSISSLLKLKDEDYIRLVNEASILAFDSDPKSRILAYEIVSHAISLTSGKNPALIHAVDAILSRLANFPGQRLLRQRFHLTLESHPLTSVSLILESIVRHDENSVPGVGHPLTDFQLNFFSALQSNTAVSISAPTSAGKSFVLVQHIIQRLRAIPGCLIVYLVPTRALIREVMLRLRKELTAAGLAEVPQSCVPLVDKETDTSRGMVFVLTQERLLSLLQVSKDAFHINLLIVDEAQGIRDGSRGVLLQTGVQQTLNSFPGVEVVFASPLIKNPEYFLELFGHANGTSFVERHSPVGQNLIMVDVDETHQGRLRFALLRHGEKIELGIRDARLKFRNKGVVRQRAALAAEITGGTDCCLVYANGPSEAEDLAAEIAKLFNGEVAQEVLDLIAYIEENIHPEYPLIPALHHSVAFHHGEMPASVRSGIEDLFRSRKLRFICCTSTLLQGVNLPARHLVISRPRRGNGKPLEPTDFLNLAGRAGRLGREFHGNVWCLSPASWAAPPVDQSELPSVEASFETAVRENPHQMSSVLDGTTHYRPDQEKLITASIGRLLTEYVFTGAMPSLPTDEQKRSSLLQLLVRLRQLNLTLPREVFARNSTILPPRLERLYASLLSVEDLDQWIPPQPYDSEFYPVLVRILELLQEVLEEKKGFRFRFDAALTVRWIRQDTLREMIEGHLTWQKKNGREGTPAQAIRSIIKSIEHRVRFELVRSLRAFHDVFLNVLVQRGRNLEAESLRPLYLYLECGGCKSTLLSLVSLGFSRTSALALTNKLRLPDSLSVEQCRKTLIGSRLRNEKVPELIIREVRQLLGTPTKTKAPK